MVWDGSRVAHSRATRDRRGGHRHRDGGHSHHHTPPSTGWKTVYHNEVLARGLAASTAEQFQLQRLRWGTGAMQVLRLENPLTVSGLRLGQRIAYAATLLGWFECWRTLGYLLLPAAVLLTGAMPVRADPLTFWLAFGTTFTFQQTSLRLLSRGCHRFFLSTMFDAVRLTPNLRATLALIYPAKPRFQVTPKGREQSERDRINPPPLLVALAIVSSVAAAWFALTVAGLTPLRYDPPALAYGASAWLVVNTGLLLAAIVRTSSRRYGPERRASVRFATGLTGTLSGISCRIHEMSLTGALVSTSGPLLASRMGAEQRGLAVRVLAQTLSLGVLIRWQRSSPDHGNLYGLEFCDGQTVTQARLALALLNRELVLAGKPQTRQSTNASLVAVARSSGRQSGLSGDAHRVRLRFDFPLPIIVLPARRRHLPLPPFLVRQVLRYRGILRPPLREQAFTGARPATDRRAA